MTAQPRRHRRRPWSIAAALGTLAVAAIALLPAGTATAASPSAATSDTSPVNLAANVNLADGKAKQSATVLAGEARFEVLAPDVIRMEYAPTGSFLDRPTMNILDRNLPVPAYTASRADGKLTITTSGIQLSYTRGSGAFTTANTQVRLLSPAVNGTTTASPAWEWECSYGQVCQSGAATLAGGAALASDHAGYQSPAGFVASLHTTGSAATWSVLGAPAGEATVTLRYANSVGAIGGPAPRHVTLDVNGAATQVTLPATAGWDDWATVSEPVILRAGQNTVAVQCAPGDDCNVNVDDLAVTAPGASAAPLQLPEYVFGNWFSRYYPYTTDEYEQQLLPAFKANGVSLDTLSADTDWKSPNQWDGWEWNSALFPDPSAFLAWGKQEGIHVTLNVHSSIGTNDPQYAAAQELAGGDLATTNCNDGPCAVWDWSKEADAESNFALQQPLNEQGVAFWWLDWCCDNSNVSLPGVTPDSWINHLYAQQMVNSGQRGFDLARIGGSLQDSVAGATAAGPWADHRSAIAFTGDTWSTWNTLATEAELSQDEGSIGVPYVSDDIGGFLGPPSGTTNDPDDLYLRWLQLGTFQPIMREHSNAGQNARLPWDYDSATAAVGDQFMQLRESLVPYLYTLAQQSTADGLPMTRALYLDYPDQQAAYDNPTEYTLGPDVLVAPVTTPGQVATVKVWFPPGQWTDWFTGATFTGPSTRTLPVITSVSPATASTGQVVTVRGVNFGPTQGSSYITFSDDGTNWGAPPDAAAFTVDSWSDDQVTFTIPAPSGSGGQWHVDPGSTATITVTTASGSSSPASIAISG